MGVCDICERAGIAAPTNIKLRHSACDTIFDLSLILFPGSSVKALSRIDLKISVKARGA